MTPQLNFGRQTFIRVILYRMGGSLNRHALRCGKRFCLKQSFEFECLKQLKRMGPKDERYLIITARPLWRTASATTHPLYYTSTGGNQCQTMTITYQFVSVIVYITIWPP